SLLKNHASRPSRGFVMTEDSSPLRNDVHLLGHLLGEVLREQQGEALFSLVEQLRQQSTRQRKTDEADMARLRELLSPLDDDQLLTVARAFSQFLNQANLAEQRHQVRLFRQHKRQTQDSNQSQRLDDKMRWLLSQGVNQSQLRACLE